MQTKLKSTLLSILGASAILGNSLLFDGCKKSEETSRQDFTQSYMTTWKKEKNVVLGNYIRGQRVLTKQANCLDAEFHFSLDVTAPKENGRLSIYPYMRTFLESENVNLQEQDAQKQNIPVRANLPKSDGYIVFSQPVKNVVSGDRGDIIYVGKVRDSLKIVDEKKRKKLIAIAKMEEIEGEMFGKGSEVYQMYYGEDKTSLVICPIGPRNGHGKSFMWAFSTPIHFEYERTNPNGLSVAMIGDFLLEKENGENDRRAFCVTMAQASAQFPQTEGYWLIPSQNAVLNINKDNEQIELYCRPENRDRTKQTYSASKYNSRKDTIKLDPYDANSPQLARKIAEGETLLQIIHSNGNRETLKRVSREEARRYQ